MSAIQQALIASVASGGDPYWASVTALCHFDGTNNSTTIVDEKSNTWICDGNGMLKTAEKKFGTASFNASSDPATLSNSIHSGTSTAAFSFPGDFTMELFCFWTLATTTNFSPVFAAKWNVASHNEYIFYYFNGDLGFLYSTDGTTNAGVTAAWTPTQNIWYHIAAARSGNDLRFFVDGVQQGTTQTVTGTVYSAAQSSFYAFTDGANVTRAACYFDEYRLTKGVARYTANFTPPAAPFPNS